eukprot:CAMPEP_0181330020 /NCGR_PEP_ID=MMETSP1101-20121128/23655_1 /TAXON_ID=46948 /ORGANISM="Rhodomonas abbreviata, Strain Caron Lab Isolate" /LENGTH=373 /DNA_ID=CAMNT_0023439205 /DNA_START=243 /DNA_END=1361 /DNA_ORIENTATION=+
MDRRVYLASRVRPLTPREISMGSKSCIVVDDNCTTLVNPETGDAKAFVLDYSYDSTDASRSEESADNHRIFKDVGTKIVSDALQGFNTCFFAHGQPQTGKTYTLIGQESDPGFLPRLLESLFQQEEVVGGRVAVFASFYELAQENVRDVLRRDFYTPGGLKVRMRSDGSGSDIDGLTKSRLKTMADCEEFLAQVLRCMGGLAQSSHTFFTIELFNPQDITRAGSEKPRPISKVHLVDLAGSTAGGGDSFIGGKPRPTPQDKSLLAWANVMSALAESQMLQGRARGGPKGGKIFVPFRGSVLTRILEDSMGPRSRSYVIANLSPSHLAYKETLNTFRLIVRTKEVKKVVRNDQILNAYLGDTEFIPAAGGGWRW